MNGRRNGDGTITIRWGVVEWLAVGITFASVVTSTAIQHVRLNHAITELETLTKIVATDHDTLIRLQATAGQ